MDAESAVQMSPQAGAAMPPMPGHGGMPGYGPQPTYGCWSQGPGMPTLQQQHQQQHRPEHPSTSSGAPMPPYSAPDAQSPYYPAMPMNAGPDPNVPPGHAGFYPPGQPPMYGGHMPPMSAGMPMPSNGDFQPPPAYTPGMARSAPSVQARQSPFPNQAQMMGRMGNAGGPGQNRAYVFNSEMLNMAAMDVRRGACQSIVAWHEMSQMNRARQQQQAMAMMENGQRNSPSYPPPQGRSLKRKNTSQSDQNNPTPSPQMPGSVPEFRQPMSNQPTPAEYTPKSEIVKIESNPVDENNPLKKMEIMASFNNEPPAKTVKTENGKSSTKEEKLAKLDQIERTLNPTTPMYPQAGRYPNGMPNNPNFPQQGFPQGPGGMPPQYVNAQQQAYAMAQQGFPPGGPPYPPNAMPPATDPSQMNPAQFAQPGMVPMPNGAFMPGQPGMPPMTSPRYHQGMPPAMMQMQPNGRPAGYMPQMDCKNLVYGPTYGGLGVPRGPPGAPDPYGWQQGMPQSLTNLETRIPSQKMHYYGNGQPQLGGQMPPPASSSTT